MKHCVMDYQVTPPLDGGTVSMVLVDEFGMSNAHHLTPEQASKLASDLSMAAHGEVPNRG